MSSHLKVLIAALGVVGVMPLAHAYDYDEYAPVVRVTPHVTTVNEPQQVCRTESVPVQREHHWFRGDDITFQDVERCQMVDHYSSRTNGYTVTYEYHGRPYTTEMSYDPGSHVHVFVDVQPS
jgi:uncharacterized protein YcfJ